MNYKSLVCVLLAASSAAAQQPGAACSEEAAEPSKHLAKDIAKGILLDQKAIWTSPFHMTRNDAALWLTFGAITGALIATDSRSTRQLPNTKDQLAFGRDVSHLGAVYTLVPVIGGLFLSGVLTKQPKLRETGLLGGEAVVDALIVSEIFKVATGRQRPWKAMAAGTSFTAAIRSHPATPSRALRSLRWSHTSTMTTRRWCFSATDLPLWLGHPASAPGSILHRTLLREESWDGSSADTYPKGARSIDGQLPKRCCLRK